MSEPTYLPPKTDAPAKGPVGSPDASTSKFPTDKRHAPLGEQLDAVKVAQPDRSASAGQLDETTNALFRLTHLVHDTIQSGHLKVACVQLDSVRNTLARLDDLIVKLQPQVSDTHVAQSIRAANDEREQTRRSLGDSLGVVMSRPSDPDMGQAVTALTTAMARTGKAVGQPPVRLAPPPKPQAEKPAATSEPAPQPTPEVPARKHTFDGKPVKADFNHDSDREFFVDMKLYVDGIAGNVIQVTGLAVGQDNGNVSAVARELKAYGLAHGMSDDDARQVAQHVLLRAKPLLARRSPGGRSL